MLDTAEKFAQSVKKAGCSELSAEGKKRHHEEATNVLFHTKHIGALIKDV